MLLDNDSSSNNDSDEGHNNEDDISCDSNSITEQHNRHNSPFSSQLLQLSSYLAFSALFPAIQASFWLLGLAIESGSEVLESVATCDGNQGFLCNCTSCYACQACCI